MLSTKIKGGSGLSTNYVIRSTLFQGGGARGGFCPPLDSVCPPLGPGALCTVL